MKRAAAVLLVLALLLASPLRAEPAPPQVAPQIARLEFGVFCALQEMARTPAPGTLSGFILVPDGEITFHWPGRQVVPASIGLAFGVRATGVAGWQSAAAEVRVYRPGRDAPETWQTGISDAGGSIAFFRFDWPEELVTGLWAIEVWDGDVRLYRAEFEVVPAAAVPEIAEACGATS